MIAIPAGSFMMGSTEEDNEKPPHQVTLTAFHIGKYPVTQELFSAVMGNNPSHFKKGDKYPVESVSWDDAQEFCRRLSKMTGKTYRLPSEAQWEYAARARTQTRYYFGDNENQLKEYAWYKDNSNKQTHPVGQKKPNKWGLYDMLGNVWDWYEANSNRQTQPVGQKKPNQWGLYDMLGNAWEWCLDDYHPNYNGVPKDGRAWIDNDNRSQSKDRILRGGSCHSYSRNCSCFRRFNFNPAGRNYFYGFRVVC